MDKRMSGYLNNPDNRRLLSNIVGNYIIKGASMVVSLLIMPAYLRFFQSQALLGAWFALTSVVNWALMFDFGIGSGVRNQIVPLLETKDKKGMSELLSSAYISTLIIIISLTICIVPIISHTDWYVLLGVSQHDIDAQTLKATVCILIAGVLLRFASVIVSHVLYAMQRASLPSLMILSSNILVLAYLQCAPAPSGDSSIIALAVFTAVANNIPAVIAMIAVYGKRGLDIHISPRYFNWEKARSVIGLGGAIFCVQLLSAFVFQLKEPLISYFVGASQVVDYQIYYKLIGMVGGLFALALTPIWSAVTKAYFEGKSTRIKRLYRFGLIGVFVFSSGQFLLLYLSPYITDIWLGGEMEVSLRSGLVFCIYNILYMWITLHYNILCGLGRVREIAYSLAVSAVLNIIFAVFLSSAIPSWESIILATSIAVVPCAVLFPRFYSKCVDSLDMV